MAPALHTQHSPNSTMPNSSSTIVHAAPTMNGDVHAPTEHRLPSPSDTVSTPVNRKKQKRRQKQAARLAVERQLANGHVSTDAATQNGSSHANPESYHSDDADADDADQEQPTNGDAYHKDGQDSVDAHLDSQDPQGSNGTESSQKSTGRKSKKKKGKKGRNDSHAPGDETSTPLSTPSVSMSHPLPPPLPPHLASRSILKPAKNRSIWNTSTQEERENIKTFWLELGEEERRQLVKVEKDAVLKKMKEQQRHSCSCTVCGRKRTAIEEELEVLYDAYYEELEQYANHNQGSFDKGSPMVPPPRLYQPPLRSPGQHTRTQGQFHPSRGRIQELTEDDDDLEEDYDEEEEDDEPYSDEELDEEDEETRAARADFFAFGNSLTVKVADDLLKNDGKHFIDMMEQLAERRMQREEDTQYGIAAAHESLHSGHNHGPFDDEDYDDEEDEDYDSQEEEDYEEDEMDAMTEEQRMEEGRRMFQIFAARMFEQRVLTAYREKVAEQRQQKLIEELLEEETRNEQRNAKKAREAQKRKDKKRLQKQAKEEERARREAEKAAEEAAAKAEQEKKLEEQRKKREEQRKKKEAERKAQEEERARKEAEKLRRQRSERERQAEAERKQREEKKRREEARRKEKEERELQEKKAKEERDRKAQEEQARKDTAKGGEEAKDHEKRDDQAKRLSQQGPVHIPSNLHHPQGFSPAVAHSPHVQSATPVVPKAPTPARPRQPSQQDSHSSSPHSQPPSTDPSQASLSPRSMPVSQSSGVASVNLKQGHGLHAMLHQPQPSAPLSPLGRSIPPGFSSVNGIPPNPPGLSGMVARPPVGHDLPSYPPHSGPFISQFRGYPAPNGIPAPPGINGARPMPPGRGFPLEPGHGFAFHGQQQIPGAFSTQQGGLPHRHSRQPSGSFERSPLESHTQPMPISRPSPIKRPSSTQQDQQKGTTQRDVDDLSAHLGSSALLDDTDVPLSSNLSQSLPGATAPGSFPGPARASFGGPSLFPDPLSASGWSNNAFGSGGHHRAHTSRPVAIRLLVIQACKQLNTMSPFKGADGYHDVNLVLHQVEQLRPQNEPSISLKEMLDICDTEGNTQNGGGTFSTKKDETGEFVKFEPDNNSATSGHRGSIVPGEIGSPVPSSSLPAFGGIGTPSVLRQYSSPPMGF
ncbi:putative stress response protein Nst1 [Aspergillus thermomutatus]|uniref:Stress response protein NST1 n=1 Tax=Aspergillus thermomutatus TaxID=41047 RepID=A0A397I3T8_ASPTH|nr:Stress response protein nst1 [Aspergillus thermomutatus]RHZ67510.1 Stress response protein nst1 [Aspergillus thermomutatus]